MTTTEPIATERTLNESKVVHIICCQAADYGTRVALCGTITSRAARHDDQPCVVCVEIDHAAYLSQICPTLGIHCEAEMA